jgi:hypothetical protein
MPINNSLAEQINTAHLARSLRPLGIDLHVGTQGDTGATTASYAPVGAAQ